MYTKINNKQSGFTILEVVLVAVVIVLVGTVGVLAYKRTTQTANLNTTSSKEEKKDRPIAVETKAEDEAEKVSIAPVPEPAKPAPAPAPPPAAKTETKKTYTYITLNLQDVQVGDSTVRFEASWAGSYTGTCTLTSKNLNTGAKIYKEAAVSAAANCGFDVPKSEYSAGEWKYYINFYAKDGTVKGESTYKTFVF